MNILFVADRGYVEHISICIHSVVRFPVEEGYDIYILHSDWTEKEEEELQKEIGGKARLHFYYVDPEMFDAFPESPRYPKLIYYRIFAASLLPESLDRILYLDGDTLVINSLEELYHMDFGEDYFLACTHVRKVLNKMNLIRLDVEEDEYHYINSGVLLMNLEQLRQHQNVKEVLQYVKERGAFFLLPDQDVITALYGDRTRILDTMKYNLSDRMFHLRNVSGQNSWKEQPEEFLPDEKQRIDLEWVRKNTVIIHYYGRQKPWNSHYLGKLDVFYQELLEELT